MKSRRKVLRRRARRRHDKGRWAQRFAQAEGEMRLKAISWSLEVRLPPRTLARRAS